MVKLVEGVGVNDAGYKVQVTLKGNKWICPYYRVWASMIKRCYSKRFHKIKPSYAKCTLCEDWLLFSNFKGWMEEQDWEGKCLDKDIIKIGNNRYCPDYCCFVDKVTNNFVITGPRANLPIGVTLSPNKLKFDSYCNNPFTGKKENLGRFEDPDTAHLAWKKRKLELAIELCKSQKDPRVIYSLIQRYQG